MTQKQQQPNSSHAEREARRAAALRENLRKRKQQQADSTVNDKTIKE